MSRSIDVLVLAADHRGSTGLRLDDEIRTVLQRTRSHADTTRVDLHTEIAASSDDVRDALLRHTPQVVHVASHGDGEQGIVLDDGTRLDPARLRTLFATFREVRLVVLNICSSLPAAEALSDVVDHVIAMELPIDDRAAIRFSGWLYSALAAGRDVATAFALARDTMHDAFGADHALPRLLSRPGSSPAITPARRTPGASRAAGSNTAENNDVDGAMSMVNAGAPGGRNVARGNRVGASGSLVMSNER
jgi:hypothetical protein